MNDGAYLKDKETYVYFLYSEKQERDRTNIEATINKIFVPGEVLVRGRYEKFTEMSKKSTNSYNDSKIVAEGYQSTMRYKAVSSKGKR